MFRYQFSLVLALLLSLILVQAGTALWSNSVASEHIQRGQISNQILQNFMQLSTEKQQLKIWLAEYLLTKDGSTLKRDMRFSTLEDLLNTLYSLTEQAQQHGMNSQDFAEITQQIKVISLFETNFGRLKTALRSWEIAKISDDNDRWVLLSEAFDNVENTDLRQLLNEAIALQQARTARYEAAAIKSLSDVKNIIITLSLLAVVFGSLLGGWLLRTLSKPLEALVNSTSALEQGHLNHRVPVSGPSELKTLAQHFNYMAQSLETAQQKEVASRQLIEREVTARTKALANALETLEQAKRQQKEFFANVSHELRTPATAILGEAQITLRSRHNTDEDYRQTLQRINESALHLSYRIDDLLLLIRQDEQLFQPALTPMTLADLWQAVTRQASLLTHAHQVQLECVVPSEDDWQTRLFYTDLDKLLMTVRIIVDNALRYDPEHQSITLSLVVEAKQFHLRVQDHGIGIAQGDLECIFQRYFRAENGKRYRPDGLGIGLALAHNIVQQQHGTIALQSELNQGTVVTLTFQLDDEAA